MLNLSALESFKAWRRFAWTGRIRMHVSKLMTDFQQITCISFAPLASTRYRICCENEIQKFNLDLMRRWSSKSSDVCSLYGRIRSDLAPVKSFIGSKMLTEWAMESLRQIFASLSWNKDPKINLLSKAMASDSIWVQSTLVTRWVNASLFHVCDKRKSSFFKIDSVGNESGGWRVSDSRYLEIFVLAQLWH